MTKRRIPPELEGMQVAPGFWPVKGAGKSMRGQQSKPVDHPQPPKAPVSPRTKAAGS